MVDSSHAIHDFSEMLKAGQIPHTPQIPRLQGYAAISENDGKTFGATVASMVNRVNNVMAQPEKLTIEAVSTGNVDIHEVMIAMGKSEVAFKLMTAVAQKGVSAFDKLTQMQV